MFAPRKPFPFIDDVLFIIILFDIKLPFFLKECNLPKKLTFYLYERLFILFAC